MTTKTTNPSRCPPSPPPYTYPFDFFLSFLYIARPSLLAYIGAGQRTHRFPHRQGRSTTLSHAQPPLCCASTEILCGIYPLLDSSAHFVEMAWRIYANGVIAKWCDRKRETTNPSRCPFPTTTHIPFRFFLSFLYTARSSLLGYSGAGQRTHRFPHRQGRFTTLSHPNFPCVALQRIYCVAFISFLIHLPTLLTWHGAYMQTV
jgi:hypothetical protein